MNQHSPSTGTSRRRFIRLPKVKELTGLSKTTIWRHARAGGFPKAVTLTDGTRGWIEDEIGRWMAERIAARDATNSKARSTTQ
jgi:prophage regulatory protein